MSPEPRITPDQLRALAQVMIEMGIVDMASGDTRIVLSPHVSERLRASAEPPLEPVEKQAEKATTEEDDELLYASVT